MKRKHLILFTVVAFILLASLAGCSCQNTGTTGSDSTKSEKPATVKEGDEAESIKGSLQDLLARGKPIKCTYEGEEDGETFSGVMYIADKKARQDAKGENNGKTMEIHTIVDDKTVHFWTSEDPTKGIKMSIDQTEEDLKEFGEDVEEGQKTEAQEWEKDFDYKCSKWKVDKSKFEVPTDIEFMDMSEMIKGIGEMFGEMGADQPDKEVGDESGVPTGLTNGSEGFDLDDLKKTMCASCDSSPNPEECKKSFECN